MSRLSRFVPVARLALLITLGLFAVAWFAGVVNLAARAEAAPPVGAGSIAPDRVLAVTGTGTVSAKPDVADVRLGVSVTRSTVGEAQSAAAAAMRGTLEAIKAAGVAADDIATTTVSLGPIYEYPTTGGQKLVGYQFSNQVSATVRDLAAIPTVIDGAIAAGANTVDGVTFRVNASAAAESQARTAAMADARSRADALAVAAGVRIIGVASITETSSPAPMPIAFGGNTAKDFAATPISAGTADIVVSVSVSYLIGA